MHRPPSLVEAELEAALVGRTGGLLVLVLELRVLGRITDRPRAGATVRADARHVGGEERVFAEQVAADRIISDDDTHAGGTGEVESQKAQRDAERLRAADRDVDRGGVLQGTVIPQLEADLIDASAIVDGAVQLAGDGDLHIRAIASLRNGLGAGNGHRPRYCSPRGWARRRVQLGERETRRAGKQPARHEQRGRCARDLEKPL
jgi:hypothetical protein